MLTTFPGGREWAISSFLQLRTKKTHTHTHHNHPHKVRNVALLLQQECTLKYIHKGLLLLPDSNVTSVLVGFSRWVLSLGLLLGATTVSKVKTWSALLM